MISILIASRDLGDRFRLQPSRADGHTVLAAGAGLDAKPQSSQRQPEHPIRHALIGADPASAQKGVWPEGPRRTNKGKLGANVSGGVVQGFVGVGSVHIDNLIYGSTAERKAIKLLDGVMAASDVEASGLCVESL
jgi:hypothetical protein